jgi:hypothetical protein
MADRYSYARSRVAAKLAEFDIGTVTLTRVTPGALPDADKPWEPGTPTLDVYELDARADGVSAQYVDDTLIVATDLMVIVSPKAVHTLTDGEAADGAVVDIVPVMSDTLTIDGAEKAIKKIEAVPASGDAAVFHIFVASGG